MKKTVLITGCAKGIGKEIALEFARDGYNVIGTYNTSANEIELLKKRIEAIGVSFDCYQLDLTDEVELNKPFKEKKFYIIMLKYGAPICLVLILLFAVSEAMGWIKV